MLGRAGSRAPRAGWSWRVGSDVIEESRKLVEKAEREDRDASSRRRAGR